jgi:hypothetical protein
MPTEDNRRAAGNDHDFSSGETFTAGRVRAGHICVRWLPSALLHGLTQAGRSVMSEALVSGHSLAASMMLTPVYVR